MFLEVKVLDPELRLSLIATAAQQDTAELRSEFEEIIAECKIFDRHIFYGIELHEEEQAYNTLSDVLLSRGHHSGSTAHRDALWRDYWADVGTSRPPSKAHHR